MPKLEFTQIYQKPKSVLYLVECHPEIFAVMKMFSIFWVHHDRTNHTWLEMWLAQLRM